VYTRKALRNLGFTIADDGKPPSWVKHARTLAKVQLEEWRIPGTENIVVVSSYDLVFDGMTLTKEPTVISSGWPEGVHDEVKAMLRPVDARGWSCESYSERVTLLELIEAARCEFGDDSLEGITGRVRLYHSHHTSVSGMCIFLQFRRQLPGVMLELDYDSMWYSWGGEERPFTKLSDQEESLYYYA